MWETLHERRGAEFSALLEASERLQLASREDEVLALGLGLSRSLLGAVYAAMVLGEQPGPTRVAAAGGDPDAATRPDPAEVSYCLAVGRAVVAADGQAGAPASRSLLAPLLAGHRRLGVLLAVRPAGAPIFALRARAEELARQIALNLDRVRALTELRRMAYLDDLTSVGNRRHAERLLDSLEEGDGLLLIDLDDLKGVNDSDGHAAGDAALMDMAQFLTQQVRGADAVARFGGDEFLVVLRRCGGQVPLVARRMHHEWENHKAAATFSYGAAVHDGGDAAVTLRAADEALLATKRQAGLRRVPAWGRN